LIKGQKFIQLPIKNAS
jgi:hypothetical protein